MADPLRAEDVYEDFYAEKLWALVPETYRHEDGLGDQRGVLRGLIETIATQAATLRRDQDKLWNDAFIDLCDDWAVPYIGDLVGTRMIPALDKRGRRVDVAKTIYYRRRKGTPRVLEELIGDITPFDGVVVEAFRRHSRTWHELDDKPQRGRFSGTPRGGTADLRRPLACEQAYGAFDEFSHVADVRRAGGVDGRYSVPKLLFFLYRLRSFAVTGAAPHARAAAGTYLFDPSGRDIPLFAPRRVVPDWEAWRFPLPWELPAPIACRLLGDAEYVITEAVILALAPVLTAAGQPAAAAKELEPARDRRFPSEAALLAFVASRPSAAALAVAPVLAALLEGALVADCGKAALWPGAVKVEIGAASPPRSQVCSGSLDDFSAAPANKSLVIDPENGRFKLTAGAPGDAVTVDYAYGLAGPLGAGPYDRRAGLADLATLAAVAHRQGGGAVAPADLPADGGLSIDDSLTYGPAADAGAVVKLVIQAADQQRPYLRLAGPWTLTAAGGGEATLVIDGLWLGGDAGASLTLAGKWRSVTLRRVTLDPGGLDADKGVIAPIPLVVAGDVKDLIVNQSILGRIVVEKGAAVDRLTVADSLMQSQTGDPVLAFAPGEVSLSRTTVIGDIALDRLYATETLALGHVEVADTQWGCFRFSAADAGSRLPHPFQSTELKPGAAMLVSQRFGDPHYGVLSQAAPQSLRTGAENGSEIGVFSGLAWPIALEGLSAKIEEFMPFGLIPAFLFAT